VVTQTSWAPDALEELLAPIALYPDPLLAQILATSINAQEVLDGGNWLLQNQNLTGTQLDTAAAQAGFGPGMRALVHFPTVVDMMCQQIDWTRQVGSAFDSDQKSVLDAVQRLRMQATDRGNLKSTPQQNVSTKTEGGDVYVEVKPADPQVVYVPQYDSEAVYTTPAAEATPSTTTTTAPTTTTTDQTSSVTQNTTVINESSDDGSKALVSGLIGFGVGMLVGNSMNDDYYYPAWGAGGVYYGARPFYPPAYAYRPAYGGAFRPAYGYSSPAGYRHNYNNVRSNNNVVINNQKYYNRFNNNQNLRAGGARSPIASTRPASGNWKGQSTYAGNRNRPDNAERRPSADTRETRNLNTKEGRPGNAARVDRGYDRSGREPDRTDRTKDRNANRTDRGADRPDRGADRPDREANRSDRDRKAEGLAVPSQQPSASRDTRQRDSAFSGGEAKNSGNFQRSASARGNASAGSRQTSDRTRRR
jgi:hypothetical protein